MKKYFDYLYKDTKQSFYSSLTDALKTDKRTFVITANPEAFMFGESDETVDKMLTDKENVTVVPDGIGIVKAAEILGYNISERIPGVEIAEFLFKTANELKKSVFLFGAKQEVLDLLCEILKKNYPDLTVLGAINGYVKEKDAAFEKIKELSPDIVLAALGIPAQEKLIYKHLKDFDKGIFVGVGGSFDVLSGSKKRAPEFFIKHNVEWLYRILKEPSRLKRFYRSNIKFIFKIKKEAKEVSV